ncbi:MAG: hypothetical protein HY775_05450 [Acidobacteria bacterium]|nr:hypothetical protein [Acidobacteriota bacterium]
MPHPRRASGGRPRLPCALSPRGGRLLQGERIAALIHPHPTLSEAFGETALALAGRALHTM